MIRVVVTTATGMGIIVGVVQENLRLMQAGKEMSLDLGGFIKQAYGDGKADAMPDDGRLSLIWMYGDTHVQIIDEIEAKTGQDCGAEAREAAQTLDERLRSEGRM